MQRIFLFAVLVATVPIIVLSQPNATNPCATAIRAIQFATKVTAANRNVTLPPAFTSASTSNGVPEPSPDVLMAFANASAQVQQLTTARCAFVV